MLEGLGFHARGDELGANLALVFLAVGAYSMAINGAFGGAARSGAASAAFVSGVAFSTLTASWMSGVVFLAVSVLVVAAFAGVGWALAAALGIGAERGVVVAGEEEARPASACRCCSRARLRRALDALAL